RDENDSGEDSFKELQWASAPGCFRGMAVIMVHIVGQAAVTAFALLIISNAFQQVRATKFGPQSRGNANLSISQLPQQKNAQAHLATSADYQIRIGQMAGI